MEEVYCEAITASLRQGAVRRAVEDFTTANAPAFAVQHGEHAHGEHGIWVDFRSLVEGLLDGMLHELGGSLEALCKALDERASLEPTGPRAAAEAAALSSLLTWDSYSAFAEMMRARAAELGGSDDSACAPSPSAEALSAMGFPADAAAIALATCGETDVDAALQWLLGHPEVVAEAEAAAAERKTQAAAARNAPAAAAAASNDARPGGESETDVQFVIADCILDAAQRGALPVEEQGLLPWATAMAELRALVPRGGAPAAGGRDAARLAELNAVLARERLRVDVMVAKSLEKSNAALRERLDRERRWADARAQLLETAPKTERDLDALFRRADELRASTSEARDALQPFYAPPHRVTKTQLDEVYLFLKEKVHNNDDLDAAKDAIHAYVFQRIKHESSALVPALLELMLLEEEALDNDRTVRKMLDAPPDDGAQAKEASSSAAQANEASSSQAKEASSSAAQAKEASSSALPAVPPRPTDPPRSPRGAEESKGGAESKSGSKSEDGASSAAAALRRAHAAEAAALARALEAERARQKRLLRERMAARRAAGAGGGDDAEQAALHARLAAMEKGAKDAAAALADDAGDGDGDAAATVARLLAAELAALRARRAADDAAAARGKAALRARLAKRRGGADREGALSEYEDRADADAEAAVAAERAAAYGIAGAAAAAGGGGGKAADDRWRRLHDLRSAHDAQRAALDGALSAERTRQRDAILARRRAKRGGPAAAAAAQDDEGEAALTAALDEQYATRKRDAIHSLTAAHDARLVAFVSGDDDDDDDDGALAAARALAAADKAAFAHLQATLAASRTELRGRLDARLKARAAASGDAAAAAAGERERAALAQRCDAREASAAALHRRWHAAAQSSVVLADDGGAAPADDGGAAAAVLDVEGEDGADGADGADGGSVFELLCGIRREGDAAAAALLDETGAERSRQRADIRARRLARAERKRARESGDAPGGGGGGGGELLDAAEAAVDEAAAGSEAKAESKADAEAVPETEAKTAAPPAAQQSLEDMAAEVARLSRQHEHEREQMQLLVQMEEARQQQRLRHRIEARKRRASAASAAPPSPKAEAKTGGGGGGGPAFMQSGGAGGGGMRRGVGAAWAEFNAGGGASPAAAGASPAPAAAPGAVNATTMRFLMQSRGLSLDQFGGRGA